LQNTAICPAGLPARACAGLPAPPSPGGRAIERGSQLQIHFHGLSAEEVAAIIVRQGIDTRPVIE
jgi:hypothetical protein